MTHRSAVDLLGMLQVAACPARIPSAFTHATTTRRFPESPQRPPPMTRTEILTRYRRLRQISREHHHTVKDFIAPDAMLDRAKRLGLTMGKSVVVASDLERALVEDLAIYLPRSGRSHPRDRYAQAARFAPDSEDVIVLEAMRQASFSLWRVERRHEIAGLILRDLLRGGEIQLVDETMEKSTSPGVEMAARFLRFEGFAMTARIVVPIIPGLMEGVFDRAPALRTAQGDVLARDPRFAIGIYRAAVATGAIDTVRFRRG